VAIRAEQGTNPAGQTAGDEPPPALPGPPGNVGDITERDDVESSDGPGQQGGRGESNSSAAKMAARARRVADLARALPASGRGAAEAPRVSRTKNGFVRFLGAPPAQGFAPGPGKYDLPGEAARSFLDEWRDLFTTDSPAL